MAKGPRASLVKSSELDEKDLVTKSLVDPHTQSQPWRAGVERHSHAGPACKSRKPVGVSCHGCLEPNWTWVTKKGWLKFSFFRTRDICHPSGDWQQKEQVGQAQTWTDFGGVLLETAGDLTHVLLAKSALLTGLHWQAHPCSMCPHSRETREQDSGRSPQ